MSNRSSRRASLDRVDSTPDDPSRSAARPDVAGSTTRDGACAFACFYIDTHLAILRHTVSYCESRNIHETRKSRPRALSASRTSFLSRAIKMTSTPISWARTRAECERATRATRADVDARSSSIASTIGAAHTRASTRDRRRALAHGSSSRVRARARSRTAAGAPTGRWRCAPASARARRSRRRRCEKRRDARWTRERTRGDAESAREGSDGIGARDRARAMRAKRDERGSGSRRARSYLQPRAEAREPGRARDARGMMARDDGEERWRGRRTRERWARRATRRREAGRLTTRGFSKRAGDEGENDARGARDAGGSGDARRRHWTARTAEEEG